MGLLRAYGVEKVLHKVHIALHVIADVRGVRVAVAHHVNGVHMEMFGVGFHVFQVRLGVAASAMQQHQDRPCARLDGASPHPAGVVEGLFELHPLQVVPDACHRCPLSGCYWSKNFSASNAAMQPRPAAVTACR